MPYVSKKVDSDAIVDTSHLAGKTAIVTGGAEGLGKAYVTALYGAGMHVCVGDMNEVKGKKLEQELPGIKFVRCDVTSWPDQVALFRAAATLSPSGKIDHVVANAGIAVNDEVFSYPGEAYPSQPPNLKTIEVNLQGTLYTTSLAQQTFITQNGSKGNASGTQTDSTLTLIGSGAAFLDCPRGPQYQATKWGIRGIMHSLRRTAHYHSSRINLISPWYVRTSILPASAFEEVAKAGVEFATVEDGGKLLLRLLADGSINGRQMFLAPRKWAASGYVDLDIDDFGEGTWLEEVQGEQMRGAPVEEGLFLEGRW